MKVDLICLASGPSLTKEDCALAAKTGARILAVNNSWEIVPRCDFLYAGDVKWWRVHGKRVPRSISCWTSSKKAAAEQSINFHPATGAFNSGMRALMWALQNGFRDILLLGYDCSLKHGTHWHGDHAREDGLSNPDEDRVSKWHVQFLDVYARAGRVGATITNCSRHTDLGCFKVLTLEEALGVEQPAPIKFTASVERHETKTKLKTKTKPKTSGMKED